MKGITKEQALQALEDMDDFARMECCVESIGAYKVLKDFIRQSDSNHLSATHSKTGNEYIVIGEAINATNAQDGQRMVIYQRRAQVFVRDLQEFKAKFVLKGVQ